MADPGRRPGPNAVAVLVLLALGVAILLWRQPWQGGDDEPVAGIPADASSLLTTQFRALGDARTESVFVEAAGSAADATRFARQVWRARELVAARDVTLRYVSGGDVADRADGSAVARVEVGWRAGREGLGVGQGTVHSATVEFRVAPQQDGRLSIVDADAGEGPLPLWLAGDLSVERSSGTVVVRVDGGDAELPVETMTRRARAAVSHVVGSGGDVTVVSPRSEQQMAALVGQPRDEVAPIAAVTTRLDARDATSADAVIVLNPSVFDTMDRRAGQVVLTHEATHLMTAALGTSAPSWVVEGFADFVALRDDTAPLSVSAGQVLAEVRAGRVPQRLPTAADFDTASHGVGAVYESAWIVFRMLGERYDPAAVVRFYRDVVGGADLDDALSTTFGLSSDELTRQWQDYLSKIASTVS